VRPLEGKGKATDCALSARKRVSWLILTVVIHFAHLDLCGWLSRQCYEKVFYFLLDKHRKKRLEDYTEPLAEVPAVRVRKCSMDPGSLGIRANRYRW
jgi:hypothetical protein